MLNKKDENDSERIAVGDRVTIYRRGSKGTWTADFWHNEQHLRRSLKTRNKKVAVERATTLGAKLVAGNIEGRRPSVRIATAVADYIAVLASRNRARRTLTRYKGELAVFTAFCTQHGVKDLHQVTMTLLDKYVVERAKDHVPATVYHETVVIKQFLKWAKKRDMIASNPIADYEIAKPRPKERKTPTTRQLQLILRECTPRRQTEIAALAMTGMRVGELQGLRQKNLDLNGGWIDVEAQVDGPTKTAGSVRHVPIHPRLQALLRAVPKQDHELFLTSEPSRKYPQGGRPINTKRLNDYFKDAAARAGISGYTVHSLRHFFRTFTINAGVPQDMVDRWMGYAKQSVKDRYYHLHDQESTRHMDAVKFDVLFAVDAAQVPQDRQVGEAGN